MPAYPWLAWRLLADGLAQEVDQIPVDAAPPPAPSGVAVSRARLAMSTTNRLSRAATVNR